MPSSPRLATGRLAPRVAPVGIVRRPRLIAQLAAARRIGLVIAPPGYGKSELARQWVESTDVPYAWLGLGALDSTPMLFWRDFVASVRGVIPQVDGEPEGLLSERGPADLTFLAALIEQVESIGSPAAVVVDDINHLTERSVVDAFATLVDRVGHLVRFVLLGRSDPPLPVLRWRAAGWISEIRAEDLRFTDDEAIAAASTFGERAIGADAALALNKRAEGWPAGLHLALLAAAEAPDPDSRIAAVVESERMLSDYLVAEVLDQLPERQREVALALSVFDWFDADLCAGLLGIDAVPVTQELHRRRLFLTLTGTAAMRFHRLIRELLENELRWRDPDRRIRLHERAARLWADRGEFGAAYHHLMEIGDTAEARRLVLGLALEHVNRGDVSGLATKLHLLPATQQACDATGAVNLASSWAFAGDDIEAARWCDHAARLITIEDVENRLRLEATRCAISLQRGQIGRALSNLEAVTRHEHELATRNPLGLHFATIGARVTLAGQRFDDAQMWIARANALVESTPYAAVMVPALTAWSELATGRVPRAVALAAEAADAAARFGQRPNRAAIEALLIAAQCRVAIGDFAGATDVIESVRPDVDELGWLWHRVRLGILVAELRRLCGAPAAALESLRQLRAACAAGDDDDVARSFDEAEAAALISVGRYRTAQLRLDNLQGSARLQLLRAQFAVSSRAAAPIDEILGHRARWTPAEQLEADVLIAAAERSRPIAESLLAAAVQRGRESGWVAPFLGHGDITNRLLMRLPLDRLHPALAACLGGGTAPAIHRHRLAEPLTNRELSVLELLSTYLSYAQMGERLYLSVNTIKTNLKSLYRKLNVSSRAAAVEAAVELGLLPADLDLAAHPHVLAAAVPASVATR